MALKDKLITLEDFKAVRDVDVASNSAQFAEIKADLGDITGNEAVSMVPNHYIDLSGTSVTMSDGTPQYSSGATVFSCGMMRCSVGDKFTITGVGGLTARLWGFIDANGNVLSVSSSSASATDLVIVAPENTAWLIIHTNNDKTSYKGVLVRRELEDGKIIYIPVPYTVVKGKYVKYQDGSVISSTNYSRTNPIWFSAGDKIKIESAGDRSVAIVASYNNEVYTPVIQGKDPAQAIYTYEYTIPNDGNYVFSYRSATMNIVIRKEYDKDELIGEIHSNVSANNPAINAFKQSTYGSWTIKAFKTINYSDKTPPKYSHVLWNDPNADAYYVSSTVYSEKTKIFDWNTSISDGKPSSGYQAVVLPNGDVLFVYQTQFNNPNDEDNKGTYRKNPIIYQAIRGYEPQIIDFGNNLKPTGWLQNVGVLYSYTHNKLFISEYTRGNEATANVWAVDMPVTDVTNWHIILTKTIGVPYGNGFKHMHTAQEDPFTNILYFSSGDGQDSSQVWYSLDGGETVNALDNPDQDQYRMLNMAFTDTYVYWASDQWNTPSGNPVVQSGHSLWRCARNSSTGVLDIATLTEILNFDDAIPSGQSHAWVATYATVYLPMFNALLFLDRLDNPLGNPPSIPIRIYDIEEGQLYTVSTICPIASDLQFGFRNVAVECYPKSNEIAVSYDAQTKNNNKMLGNSALSRINNVVMRIYRNSNGYSMTFDTVY